MRQGVKTVIHLYIYVDFPFDARVCLCFFPLIRFAFAFASSFVSVEYLDRV